jgi:hypothetical protein
VCWGAQPMYAAGWLAAAAILYSARWWSGEWPRQAEVTQAQKAQ